MRSKGFGIGVALRVSADVVLVAGLRAGRVQAALVAARAVAAAHVAARQHGAARLRARAQHDALRQIACQTIKQTFTRLLHTCLPLPASLPL